MGITVVDSRRAEQCNPFYEHVKDYLSTTSLESRLNCSPLDHLSIGDLSLERRYELLDRMQEEMFEPTTTSLNITNRTYRMLGRGLQSMDPTKASVRKFSMSLARGAGAELSALPWFATYAMGMTVKGPTGVGKTYEVTRALSLIPQRIDHKASEAAGWTHLRQAVWLFVPMSHDGSLGGLLFQILCSLDAAIDTAYSSEKSLISLSNEKLAVRVGILLRTHGVGLLVIDEIQSRNFSDNARGTLAATFFLRLLNFGIPTMLIGNQVAFKALGTFSQDIRRLSAGGAVTMDPHFADDYDFKDCLAPAIWKFCVMSKQVETGFMQPDILFKYSGGIRDYACRCWISAQRLALDLGKENVSEGDLQAAFEGSDFDDRDRQLIIGFRDRDPIRLSQFTDVDWEGYGIKWGKLRASSTDNATSAQAEATVQDREQETPPQKKKASVSTPKPEKDKAKIIRRREQSKEQERKKKNAKESLDEDDIRCNGLQKTLISGFEAIRRKGA